MKTMPENLPAIVEAVKPKHMTLPWTLRWADFDGLPRWIYGDDEAGGPGDEVSQQDAYAACVVALLDKFIASGVALQIDRSGVWCMGKSYDGDLLPALYAAFVVRPDLFGEAP